MHVGGGENRGEVALFSWVPASEQDIASSMATCCYRPSRR